MKVLLIAITFMAACFTHAAIAFDVNKIQIYVRDDVYEDYKRFLNGRNLEEISDFSGQYIRRDVVDMILAQQALVLGGFRKEFEYQTGNVNFRNTKLLEQGKLLLSMDSYWLEDAKSMSDAVYISEPLIKRGEYYAGVFYSPNNKKMQQLNSYAQLSEYTSVSTPRWRTDWETLHSMPLQKLFVEHEWISQARMVSMTWADFMLMPLMPSLKNEFNLEGIKLVAHPKLVVLLDGSRHLVVSKNHPHGVEAFKALQVGLKILNERGMIIKAYTQAGFIPDLSKYKVLNQLPTR
jgi:hypothetical protein